MTTGEIIRNLRENIGMSQREFAKRIGCSHSAVGMYELGERKPKFETLEAIADLFNVDMDYLLGRTVIKRRYTFTQNGNNNIIGNGNTVGNSLPEQEQTILDIFRKLDTIGKAKLIAYADELLKGEKK